MGSVHTRKNVSCGWSHTDHWSDKIVRTIKLVCWETYVITFFFSLPLSLYLYFCRFNDLFGLFVFIRADLICYINDVSRKTMGNYFCLGKVTRQEKSFPKLAGGIHKKKFFHRVSGFLSFSSCESCIIILTEHEEGRVYFLMSAAH